MNLRIKELRKHLKMTQEAFAQKIGVQRPTVAWMEKPGNTITKQNIKIICDTFNVNEVWLRTGKGEMFKPKEPTDIMERLQEELKLDARDLDLIKAFVELPPEQRKEGIRFLEALSVNIIDLLPNSDATCAKIAQDSDTKKDVPSSTSVFRPTTQQVTGKLPASYPQDSTAQPNAPKPQAASLSKLTERVDDDTKSLSKLTAQSADDGGSHDITVNDEELEVVQMMRREKTPTSGSSSCTMPRRA